MLVEILIVFFLLLLINQIYLAFNLIEGLETEYKEYDKSDPLILSKQNAGNIEVLKQKMDSLSKLDVSMNEIYTRVGILETHVTDTAKANANIVAMSTPEPGSQISGMFNDDSPIPLSSSPLSITPSST